MCSVDSVVFADFTTIQMFVFVLCITTRTTTVLRPFVRDYLDESVPEETFTHSPILIIVVICVNYVGAVLGISALSVGFTDHTGFTFKLVHGEKMSETVGHIELNRYVVQVLVLIVVYFGLNWHAQPFRMPFSCLCMFAGDSEKFLLGIHFEIAERVFFQMNCHF